MINSGSRYTKSTDFNDDEIVSVAVKTNTFTARRTMTITTVYGDTFDKIAARILGDSTQYWKIAGLNPTIRFPDLIPVGTTIIVPI